MQQFECSHCGYVTTVMGDTYPYGLKCDQCRMKITPDFKTSEDVLHHIGPKTRVEIPKMSSVEAEKEAADRVRKATNDLYEAIKAAEKLGMEVWIDQDSLNHSDHKTGVRATTLYLKAVIKKVM